MTPRPAIVIPSSLRSYTGLLPCLIEKNPDLAQQVVNALNHVDRSRNKLYRQVMGDKPRKLRVVK